MRRVLKIVLSWLIIICLPIISIGTSANMLFRLPDIYQFQMNASRVLSSYNAGGQEEKVAQAIGKYMQYRAEEFQYQYDEEEEMALLFSKNDQEGMAGLRKRLNISLALVVLSALIVILTYVILIKDENLEIIRIRFKMSLLLYFAGTAIATVFSLAPALNDRMLSRTFGMLEEADLMYAIFHGGFFKYFAIANIVVSLVITVIMMYFTWKNTKPKNIFW